MARDDLTKEWHETTIQICTAIKRNLPLEEFACIRDRLLTKDGNVSGMIYALYDALARSGYDLEHVEGVQWDQFRTRARKIKQDVLGTRPQDSKSLTRSYMQTKNRLRQLSTILDRWPSHVLHYGLDSKGQTKIKCLFRCAQRFPHFEKDFVPIANYVLVLKHRAALRGRSYDKTIGFYKTKCLWLSVLSIIAKLGTSSTLVSEHGEQFTLEAALSSSELVESWITSKDGCLSVRTELLKDCQQYAWPLFLLQKDRYGLLHAKPNMPYD